MIILDGLSSMKEITIYSYTSQLNVVFSSDLSGQTMEYASDSGSQIAIFNTILDTRMCMHG